MNDKVHLDKTGKKSRMAQLFAEHSKKNYSTPRNSLLLLGGEDSSTEEWTSRTGWVSREVLPEVFRASLAASWRAVSSNHYAFVFICLYLSLPTSSFFSSWRMLIRILIINLLLPLYSQAASIDGCAARLSASEVWFFTFCLFLLVAQDLFCRFYLPGAISVQHALSSSTRKRENGGGYENNFTFSV